MNIQLMIEVETEQHNEDPKKREATEQYWLRLLGLESYLKNLMERAYGANFLIKFDVRVKR